MNHYHPDPGHTPDDGHIEVEYEGPVEAHPLWQRDNVLLHSVGIDIGSAGTQVLFSRVHLRRQAVDLSSRYLVVDRETLFESPVCLTPYESDTLIDARALGEIVDDAYFAAGVQPKDIDTGVVILTGEALRRKNSEPIARILSEKCGDLVCATAGHHMEAMLAAHGSGAAQISFDRGECILNLDIGGGTCKLSVIKNGKVVSTAALHIGGRLLAVGDHGEVERLDPAGTTHATRAGVTLALGEPITDDVRERIANSMANDLVRALNSAFSAEDVAALYLTDPIEHLDQVNSVVCSGGVAEYVYCRETRDFGDLGKVLGAAIRERFDSGTFRWPLVQGSHGIRATALGCSEFTAQISGNTGYFSAPDDMLPRRNLKVLQPEFEFGDDFNSDDLASAIRQHATLFEVDLMNEDLVLALHWDGPPKYHRLRSLAVGIRHALRERITARLPIYIILDADIAMNLGAILHEEMEIASEIMVVDGLALWNFDSVDLGKIRKPSMTIPVTIKSLIFSDVSDNVRRRELVHHPQRSD